MQQASFIFLNIKDYVIILGAKTLATAKHTPECQKHYMDNSFILISSIAEAYDNDRHISLKVRVLLPSSSKE